MIEIPVLIVGGGPVGLTASILLSRHGVRSVLVERHPGTAILPKARGINARTMEMYRQLGIETAIREAGLAPERTGFIVWTESLAGREIERRIPGRMAPANRTASPVLNCLCAQDDLEPVLRRFAEAQAPAELRFNSELIAVEQDADGVTATILDRVGGGETTIRSNYLIAADGSQSRVRPLVAREMIGRDRVYDSVNILFRADLRPWVADRPAALYFVEQPDLRATFLTINAHDRWGFLIHSLKQYLFAVQQRRRLGDVGFIGGGALDCVHQPRGDIDPDVGLHPEIPLIALPGLMHLRVAALLFVLGRGRSGDDRGVDNRPLPHQQAALLQHRVDFLEQSLGQIVPLQPMPEMQHRGRVGDRVAVQHRSRQSRAVLGCRRMRPRPLHRPTRTTAAQNRPQHAFQGDRRPTALAFRIERGYTPEDFTPQRCIDLIRKGVGEPDLPVEILGVSYWEASAIVADRYRDRRLFLAGDAAHEMPPTGGFGMNTGVQDAQNLVWKLAAVLKGQAGEGLLDTYYAERQPLAMSIRSSMAWPRAARPAWDGSTASSCTS